MTVAEQELKQAFNDWFIGLLHDQESCLLRDVLRENKMALWLTFKRIKPVYTSADSKPTVAQGLTQ